MPRPRAAARRRHGALFRPFLLHLQPDADSTVDGGRFIKPAASAPPWRSHAYGMMILVGLLVFDRELGSSTPLPVHSLRPFRYNPFHGGGIDFKRPP